MGATASRSKEKNENQKSSKESSKKPNSSKKKYFCIGKKKHRSKKIVDVDLDSNVCLNLNPSQSPAENRTYIADSYEHPAELLPPQEYESAQIEPEIILTNFMTESEEKNTNIDEVIEPNITAVVCREVKLTEYLNIKEINLQRRRSFFNQDSNSSWISTTQMFHPVETADLPEITREIHNTAFGNAIEDDSAIDNSLKSKSPNVPDPTKEESEEEEAKSGVKNSPNSLGSKTPNVPEPTKEMIVQEETEFHSPNDFIKDEREVDIQSENLDNYDIEDDNNMNILKDNNIEGKNREIDNIRGKGEAETNKSAQNHIESEIYENGDTKDKGELEGNKSAFNCTASDNGDMKNDKGSVETATRTDNHIDDEISQNHDMHDEQGEIKMNAPTDNQMESENRDSKDYKNGGETNTHASEKSEIEDNKEDSNQCGAESGSVPMKSWEPQGFSNPFGYCYLNSVVQSLVSCEEFRKAMTSYRPSSSNNHRDLTFVLGLCYLIRGLKKKDENKVRDALRTIQSHCNESAFGDDIFKCFMNILSRISNVIGYNSQENPNSSTESTDKAEINFRKQKNKNQGFVFDNFYGQLVFQTVCKRCKHVANESFQLMKSLPLPIPSTSRTVSLDMCIEEFFKESDIESDIPMSCKCDSGTSIDLELRTKMTHTPRYLFMYLNRGSYNNERKNETNVKSELVIKIKTARGEEVIYDLISVIDHVGTNEFGHYYCKCCYDGETWWCLNDSNVQHMPSFSGVVCQNSIGFIFKKHESHP